MKQKTSLELTALLLLFITSFYQCDYFTLVLKQIPLMLCIYGCEHLFNDEKYFLFKTK